MNRHNEAQVYVECKREHIGVGSLEILNVSEGFDGRDEMIFKCPYCGKEHTSKVWF